MENPQSAVLLRETPDACVDRRTSALRRINAKLQKEIAARRRLEQEILEIAEREQQRIGRDLHDDLGQRLVGICYLSHRLANSLENSGSAVAVQAVKISALLNDALELTRSLARGLHPVVLKSGGLLAALGDLAERSSGIFQIKCRFDGPPTEPELTENVSLHLYRIAQEAVTNAVNHGHAAEILIRLVMRPGSTALSVADDGCGMPKTATRTKGMGLRIMNYRAEVIGGTLAFSKSPGGGTLVACTIPTS